MNLLEDDRNQYANGKKISDMTDEEYEKQEAEEMAEYEKQEALEMAEYERQEKKEMAEYEKQEAIDMVEYEKQEAEEMATFIKENKKPNETEDELFKRIKRENEEFRNKRLKKVKGGSLLEDDNAKIISMITEGKIQAGEEALNESVQEEKLQKEITTSKLEAAGMKRISKDIGGSLPEDSMSEMPMEEMPMDSNMSSDDDMEKEFLDFILDEALSSEEEEMFMSKIEQDEQLAELFDKVIEVAQEFAGSGPVEGPGSGVSDSIPARLSDGEFVFTAASVEEIGADNLMAMMKDAEMKAEERQGLAEGGEPDEETVTMKVQEQKEPKIQIAKATVNSTRGLLDEDEISKGIKSKMMLDPNQRHVRS